MIISLQLKALLKSLFIASIFFNPNAAVFSQQETILLSGHVRDELTKELLVGAKILIPSMRKGATTNVHGFYSLEINTVESELLVQVSAAGYKTLQQKVVLNGKTKMDFSLAVSTTKEVEIIHYNPNQLEEPEIGVLSIPMTQLKNIPSLAGEPDVIKAFQLMPGVSGGQEGSSGIFVRGGSPDQNLFLLDDVPLYYVNHIGGFFSTFDANAISSVKLYKSGFPARYAGRLSSVVDIQVKEGNLTKHQGELAVGLITSKIYFEGPIGKDSSLSYLVSARRFNLDLFIRPLARIQTGLTNTAGYTFYDLNGKLVKRFKNGGQLAITAYEGRDRIFVKGSRRYTGENQVSYTFNSNIRWGNFMATAVYTQQLTRRTFFSTSLSSTNFKYNNSTDTRYSDPGFSDLVNRSRVDFISGVNDLVGKAQFETKIAENYKVKSGVSATGHRFTPGKIVSINTELDTVIGAEYLFALETNAYVENHLKIGNKIVVNAGLNFNSFFIQDTAFHAFQPRITAALDINKSVNLQMGYSRMTQNMHYLANSGLGMPSDLWLPATKLMVPEVSNQYNLGITYALRTNKKALNFVLEAFYKDMKNLIDYKDGIAIYSPSSILDKIAQDGTGTVYGLEFLIQKNTGRWTGWIGYTWSKNMRQFDALNFGKPYPFLFDRRHDFSLVLSFKVSENIILNASWVYMTGNAITLGQGSQLAPDFLVLNEFGQNNPLYEQGNYYFHQSHVYNGKNGYRLPAFHKLDFSASFTKTKPKGIRTWNIGIYNAYNRHNPLFLFYQANENNEVKLNQLTLFPIIPSVSYSFVFDTRKFFKRKKDN